MSSAVSPAPMMITERSKSVIPFRAADAARVGEGCFYLDTIVWLNRDAIEMGDRVGFNYGCYVNGFGGLVIGDRPAGIVSMDSPIVQATQRAVARS